MKLQNPTNVVFHNTYIFNLGLRQCKNDIPWGVTRSLLRSNDNRQFIIEEIAEWPDGSLFSGSGIPLVRSRLWPTPDTPPALNTPKK